MRHKKAVSDNPSLAVPPMVFYDYFEGFKHLPLRKHPRFSLYTSAWMAEFALLAYEEPNFAKNILRYNGFTGFKFFANKSTEAFVAWNNRIVVTSFRGTELKSSRSFLDLFTDVSFTPAKFPGGCVHSGFRSGFLTVWDHRPEPPVEGLQDMGLAGNEGFAAACGMSALLTRLQSEKKRRAFFFTGHSLGAALATLAASIFPAATALYTFGSPMVGDADFAASLHVPHYRWVHNRDVVTLLPPPELIEKMCSIRYVHSGVEKYINSGGSLDSRVREPTFVEVTGVDFVTGITQLSPALTILEKGLMRFMQGKRRIRKETKAILDSLHDHMPIQYSVHIWNLLCR